MATTVMPATASSTALPAAIHIVIAVYGQAYCELFADIGIPNLAAMVGEIPEELRRTSAVLIFTRAQDMPYIEASAAMPALRASINVELVDKMTVGGFEQHGKFGPMVLTQQLAVIQAARVNAALFFVGPDQIYSKGSFAYLVARLREGYRLVIGPSLRVKRDALRPFLLGHIAAAADGIFALTPEEQIETLFRYWQPMNDQFRLGGLYNFWWRYCLHYRPHPDHLLIRFLQGPTLMAWPNGPQEAFEGFVDHAVPLASCRDWRDVHVVADARDCLALDMADDERIEGPPEVKFPRYAFQSQLLFHRKNNEINWVQLIYGFRTCRVDRTGKGHPQMRRWQDEFARAVDPFLYMAFIERRVRRYFGKIAAAIVRQIILFNVNALSLLLALPARRFAKSRQQPAAAAASKS
ncbi:MAG: hypothetical protein ABSD31_09215 [Candidatus Binataceae bacterium]|jgi:hypothetical protein